MNNEDVLSARFLPYPPEHRPFATWPAKRFCAECGKPIYAPVFGSTWGESPSYYHDGRIIQCGKR